MRERASFNDETILPGLHTLAGYGPCIHRSSRQQVARGEDGQVAHVTAARNDTNHPVARTQSRDRALCGPCQDLERIEEGMHAHVTN